jgi:hypothetical protein
MPEGIDLGAPNEEDDNEREASASGYYDGTVEDFTKAKCAREYVSRIQKPIEKFRAFCLDVSDGHIAGDTLSDILEEIEVEDEFYANILLEQPGEIVEGVDQILHTKRVIASDMLDVLEKMHEELEPLSYAQLVAKNTVLEIFNSANLEFQEIVKRYTQEE